MNDKRLNQLFGAARGESAPLPPPGFAEDVLRAVRQAGWPAPAPARSLWDNLNDLFPLLAPAAAILILACLAADWGVTSSGTPGIAEGASQMASQYFFTASTEDL